MWLLQEARISRRREDQDKFSSKIFMGDNLPTDHRSKRPIDQDPNSISRRSTREPEELISELH